MVDFNPIASFKDGMRKGPPWDSITEFATHPSFCGMLLYPRQLTLLKVIYLEEDQFTQYDYDVIGRWTEGFKDRLNPIGVQPDLLERIHYLKDHGYTHFPHVQMVLGRRASKGILGGILTAERVAYLYSLGDWQAHFNQVRGQIAEVQVVAPSLNLAVTRQFKDIRNTIIHCGYLREHIVGDKITEFFIRTPGDEQTIINNQLAGIQSDREIATIALKASTSASTSGRGGTGIVNCLDPETPVLTAALEWVPIKRLCAGDEIIAVDEVAVEGSSHRRVRKATVLSRWSSFKKAYRLTFDDGSSVTCSGDHRWLCRDAARSHNYRWRKVREKSDYHSMKPGTQIVQLVEPWEPDESREAGYLAGIYDGEGCVSNRTGAARGTQVMVSQLPGTVLNTTLRLLKEKGFTPMPQNANAYVDAAPKQVQQWSVRGISQVLRFLGQIRPHRLLERAHLAYDGAAVRARGEVFVRTIVSIEELPEQELVDISTSTGTFIANGLVSHNCYDEYAHMITGTGSGKTGEEIYDAFQPSLDQFGSVAMTYIASSPYSKIGKFYELYQQGRVTMEEYNAKKGKLEIESFADKAAVQDIDNDDLTKTTTAEPTYLVVQLPSWELYTDWDKSRQIPMLPGKKRVFPKWPGPIQFKPDAEGSADEKVQYRRKIRNPDKFKVERGGQFATVQDAYLDENMVDRMFVPPTWRDSLSLQTNGRLSLAYRAHADPSRTNANFGFCIAHLEDAPPDEYGYVWPHVIIDVLKVWKPEDSPDHLVDYVQIGEEIDDYLTRFPTIKKMSYDQYNSAGFIAHQKRKFPTIRVLEQTFTAAENQDRFEKFKSALNLGWVHSYRDEFADEGQSLLELELKFLQEKVTGSRVVVDKQDIGPVKTKDLADAVMVVTTGLLHESLDRWWKSLNRTSVGSTNVAGLRSGREQERQLMHESHRDMDSGMAYADPMTRYFATQADQAERRASRQERNKETLEKNKLDRARRNAFGSRESYEGGRNRGARR